MPHHTRITITTMFAALLAALPAGAQTYQYRTLDINKSDATSLLVITNGNAILGYETTSGNVRINYLLQGKIKTVISDPNGVTTSAYGLNNSNVIVGYYNDANNTAIGFTYQNGTYTDFQPEGGGIGDIPLAISNSGIISGYYYDNAGAHGFTSEGTKFESYSPPAGMNYVFPVGINNQKQIVLETIDAGGNYYGFLKQGRNLTQLAYPGASSTLGFQINNKGLIAGEYSGSDGIMHGFVCDTATMSYYDIDYPGAYSTSTVGINDHETLVGQYESQSTSLSAGYKAVGSIP